MVAEPAVAGSTGMSVMSFVISQLVRGIGDLDALVKKLEDDPCADTDEVVKVGFVSIREAFTAVGMCLEKMDFSGGYVNSGKKGLMEHKVMQNLKTLTGDKGAFRQWLLGRGVAGHVQGDDRQG